MIKLNFYKFIRQKLIKIIRKFVLGCRRESFGEKRNKFRPEEDLVEDVEQIEDLLERHPWLNGTSKCLNVDPVVFTLSINEWYYSTQHECKQVCFVIIYCKILKLKTC